MFFGQFDLAAIGFLQSFSSPALDLLFRAISFMGNPIAWVFIASLIYWSGRERKGIFLLNLVLLASAAVAMLKVFFAVPRPSGNVRIIEESSILKAFSYDPVNYSFPSGHATMAASASFHFRKNLKGIMFAALLIFPFAVALSRMYLGKHFLSDVIAGIVLGVALGILNERLSARFERLEFGLGKISSEIIVAFALILAIVAIAFAEVPSVAIAVIGFYAGFFVSRILKVNQEKLGGKRLLAKLLAGTAGLAAFGIAALLMPSLLAIISLLAGIWISLGMPYFYGKFCKKLK